MEADGIAGQALEQVGEHLESTVVTGKKRAAQTLGAVARSLHASSQQLRDTEPAIGRYAEQAATKVTALADFIQNTEPGEMASRVEDFARRQPALFLGGVFVAGFLGARFLKSSLRNQPSPASTGSGLQYEGAAWPVVQRRLPDSSADWDKTDREVPALAPRRDWIAEADGGATSAAPAPDHRTSVGAPRSVSHGIREQSAFGGNDG